MTTTNSLVSVSVESLLVLRWRKLHLHILSLNILNYDTGLRHDTLVQHEDRPQCGCEEQQIQKMRTVLELNLSS